MSSWRDAILNDFVPNVSKLTLVADPDGLLTEEKLAVELRQRGFDLIEFNDPVEFRYAYESGYRSIWDRGEHTDLVVILRLQNAELESLPYDLLQTGRKLSFTLGKFFPNLSYPIIEKLDRSFLDAIDEAQRKTYPSRLGDNLTKDFILLHVFRIAAETITDDVELLRTLLRLHDGNLRLPSMLAARLIQTLEGCEAFNAWPLSVIVRDVDAFHGFLQERWPRFLFGLGIVDHADEASPDCLPYGHQDIKGYIGNLFVEGKLTPMEIENADVECDPWIRVGIVTSGLSTEELRIRRLFDRVEEDLPAADSLHSAWIAFALMWAELTSLVQCNNNAGYQARLREMGDSINETFAVWLAKHYSSLINLPPNDPAMLHHVPHRLARDIEGNADCRVALIVIDGLALNQWVTVRQLLREQDRNLMMRESATFAWIPTLTSVSRQSIFSGRPPCLFPLSINSTNNDEKLWKQFWEGRDLPQRDVAYKRGVGDGNIPDALDLITNSGRKKAVGLVVNDVDDIMHGMRQKHASVGLHGLIKLWGQDGFLTALLGKLLDDGFDVWLTADHGNIECEGKGSPSEGSVAEYRGERVRVYPTSELRDRVGGKFPSAREWEPVGLPPDYFPLIACGHDAFIDSGKTIVAHGGVSIEEVIVPLVKFERKSRHE